MKILLTLFVLLFSYYVSAETYSCTYEFDGKTETTVLKRERDYFLDIYSDGDKMPLVILKETTDYIHLYNSELADYFSMLFVEVIDKKNKAFVMIGLDYKISTEVIEGPCIVTN